MGWKCILISKELDYFTLVIVTALVFNTTYGKSPIPAATTPLSNNGGGVYNQTLLYSDLLAPAEVDYV